MSFNELQAVTILFDNSSSAINGDVLPTRFEAAKSTVESLARAYLRGNRESVVGFGTLSDFDFGINTSLTKDQRTIRQNLENVKRGGKVELEKGIKCGIYSLRHKPKEITNRRLIIILCSKHTMTMEKAAELAAFTNKEGVYVEFVVFGSDKIDIDPIKEYIDKLGDGSHLHIVTSNVTVLSDAVQQMFLSANRGSNTQSNNNNEPGLDQDDDLRRALALSQQENIDGDADLQEALRLSMMEFNQGQNNEVPPSPTVARNQNSTVNEQEIDDPDLLAALQLSMQTFEEEQRANDNNQENEQKSENNEEKKPEVQEENKTETQEEKKPETQEENDKKEQINNMNAFLDDQEEMKKLYEEFGIDQNGKDDKKKK